ncbi:MAG: DUF1279 domain-containing protein [Deltaproteobacteria bacterium]|nr:MAG: DUF1279 domain-containing protein [Deltaproteobacteria bacterium]
MGWFSRARERYDDLVARYGKVAIVTYFSLFFGALFGFWAAVSAGLDLASGLERLGLDASQAASGSGSMVVAYALTKLTQPLRIGLTLVATPVIARLIGREPSPVGAGESAPEGSGAETGEGLPGEPAGA